MDASWVPTVADRYGAGAGAALRADGWWSDDSLSWWVDRWADTHPGRRAITDGVHDLDYASLRAWSYAVASWMRRAGVRAGDRVAVQLPNWAEFLVVYLAAARIGAVMVPIMAVYRHDEVAHIVRDSGAVLAVTTGVFRGFDHAAMFRELRATAPGLAELMVVRGSARQGETMFDEVVAGNAGGAGVYGDGSLGELGAHAGADTPHVVIYSSGTESAAKGCLHTWNTLAFTARALAHEVFRMSPDDTMFMPSPVAHSTGVVIGLVTPLLAGSGIHLLDVWEPGEGLRRIQEYGCTITATATPFVTMALEAAKAAGSEFDLSSMRAWLCAGAPIPRSLAREFEATFTYARLLPLYGCTEVLAATVCRLDDPIERIAGSDGAVISTAVQLKLIDENGNVAPPGQPGEICYRGPGAILGYWADPERTAEAIDEQGWHHCGDLGVMDADGYLRVTGRVKDIIIRGGQNLSAREIEEHLVAHPDIREAAVVAYPDQRLGEKVCAFAVAENQAQPTLAQLRDFLRTERKIAIQKVPERLILTAELPMTASGKIQKFILREQLERQRVSPAGASE
jgi:cyclohexanecarboxylate-CoA ligase/acyl-CoA synthetase